MLKLGVLEIGFRTGGLDVVGYDSTSAPPTAFAS